jgi:hypothetical protein
MPGVSAIDQVTPINHFKNPAPTFIGGHDLHYQYIRNVNNAITMHYQQKQIKES